MVEHLQFGGLQRLAAHEVAEVGACLRGGGLPAGPLMRVTRTLTGGWGWHHRSSMLYDNVIRESACQSG